MNPEAPTAPFSPPSLDQDARAIFAKLKHYAEESALRSIDILARKVDVNSIRELETTNGRNEQLEIAAILREYSLLVNTINKLPDPHGAMEGFTRRTIASGIGFIHELMEGVQKKALEQSNTFTSPGPEKTVEKLCAIVVSFQKHGSLINAPELHTKELRREYANVAWLLDFDESSIRRQGLMGADKLEEAIGILRQLIQHVPTN